MIKLHCILRPIKESSVWDTSSKIYPQPFRKSVIQENLIPYFEIDIVFIFTTYVGFRF